MLSYYRKRRLATEALRRDKCIEELSLNEAIMTHWREADVLLRQMEAKDSVFELEKLRSAILVDYGKNVVEPIRETIPVDKKGNLSKRNRKLYRKELSKVCKEGSKHDDIGYLKRLYYSATTMDVYKRQNRKLRRELQLKQREGFRVKKSLQERVTELEHEIERAKRESWCLSQIRIWEPTRYREFQGKALVKPQADSDTNLKNETKNEATYGDDNDGEQKPNLLESRSTKPGPRSSFLDMRDEGPDSISGVGGMVRLVDNLECPPTDLDIRQGGHYSDSTSLIF